MNGGGGGEVNGLAVSCLLLLLFLFFFFQAEDGIRSLVRSRGLGDVYKGPASLESTNWNPGTSFSFLFPFPFFPSVCGLFPPHFWTEGVGPTRQFSIFKYNYTNPGLLYTSDAADDLPIQTLGGRRTIKTTISY